MSLLNLQRTSLNHEVLLLNPAMPLDATRETNLEPERSLVSLDLERAYLLYRGRRLCPGGRTF